MRHLTCVLAFVVVALLAGDAAAQGKWVKLAPFPEPAEELLGAAAGGKLYVFAGLAPGWKPIGMVYELHMVSGDVQSAGTGVPVHSESHDAFELAQ